jgi:regulator of cell morphogenesis and NO signaling
MTVREIALQMPESTRLFERLKIDYCCGGNKPLADACAAAGMDVGTVIDILGEITESKSQDGQALDFQNAFLPELIDHIVTTHHVFTKSEMDRLDALAAKVIAAHGENHSELLLLGDLFKRLCADLTPHMFKEERVLFPYIVAMSNASGRTRPFAPFGTVNNPVRMMVMEHDAAGEILRELRAVTSDYKVPPDACISYRTLYEALENLEKDLHQHIHLENNILFPRAVDLENALNG